MLDQYPSLERMLASASLVVQEICKKEIQKSAKNDARAGFWNFQISQKEMEKMAEIRTFSQRFLEDHCTGRVLEHIFGVSFDRLIDPYVNGGPKCKM